MLNNRGHINLALSCDTAAFACDRFIRYWRRHGRRAYPHATAMLWLCDGGGSNSSSHYVFKEALQKLADRLELPIRVAHYPPYCSKYNPIEHRLFSQISINCAGTPLRSLKGMLACIRGTVTEAGLRVRALLAGKKYERGVKVTNKELASVQLKQHETCPAWNYAIPSSRSVESFLAGPLA